MRMPFRMLISIPASLACSRPGVKRRLHRTQPVEATIFRGLQALAIAMVALGAVYLRHYYTIDPAAVYRLALIKLNTHPGTCWTQQLDKPVHARSSTKPVPC